jgi:hypothetical protein
LSEIEAIIKLKKESGDQITYLHMFFGLGKKDLNIAWRVQLVVWLQMLQYWSGIAGITMYAQVSDTIFGPSA